MAAMKDITLFTLVRDFLLTYLPSQRGCSPHTLRAYRTSLELLFDFVKMEKGIRLTDISFEILSDGMIQAYLDWLESARGCCISTRNHRLRCIRAFYNYAAMMEPTTVVFQMKMCKTPIKKCPEPVVGYMSEGAVKALLSQPDTSTK